MALIGSTLKEKVLKSAKTFYEKLIQQMKKTQKQKHIGLGLAA